MMDTLGRIPVETRIAPKRENWQLSPHRRGVGELCAAVQQSAWILMGMPLPAATAPKHSCATTAEVKILHWGTAQLEMPTPINILLVKVC